MSTNANTSSENTRVILTIVNNLSLDVTCVNLGSPNPCAAFIDLTVGTVIKAGHTAVFQSASNDRLFCEFTNSAGGDFQLGMTCPKSSGNSACGCKGLEGLQTYSDTTPANFKYILGQKNLAGWDDGSGNPSSVVKYGDCS